MTTTDRARSRVLFSSFSGYRPAFLRKDVIAGLTVWAVLVPESLAYAGIAGVPPVVGLYAAVPALVLYTLLGSSRHLVVAPMSATAALSAGVVGTIAAKEDYVVATALLAIAVGIGAVVAGLLRLGFLAAFISEPVLKGFVIGLALTIIIGQVPDLLGVEKGSGDFFEKLWTVLGELGDTHPLTLVVGGLSLLAILVLRRFVPIVPGALAVAVAGIAAVLAFDLGDRGVELVGTIESGLPSVGWPGGDLDLFLELLGASVGVMLVAFVEGLGAAKAYAVKSGYAVDGNRELLGLGAANLGSGLAGGMIVNGSLSKTAVNSGAGARSQFSGLTAALLVVVTLLFLTGLFEQLPEAVLAAIVIAAVVELVDIAALRRLYAVRTGLLASIYHLASRADFLAAIATLAGVLLFETLPGLLIGIGVSLVLLLARSSRPHVAVLGHHDAGGLWVDRERDDTAVTVPGVVVVRVEGPLFFANAEHVHEAISAAAVDGTRLVVIDAETSPSIDVTAAAMLVELHRDLARRGVALVIAHSVAQVRDVLERSSEKGEPPVYRTIQEAIEDAVR